MKWQKCFKSNYIFIVLTKEKMIKKTTWIVISFDNSNKVYSPLIFLVIDEEIHKAIENFKDE